MNLALKYRPSSFKDLIGQDILVRILKNAFDLNKVPRSILLSGSSGVGKTTTARIIALCLNCSLGPTFEPCGLCENCLAIKNSSHPDVIEIDAASHTSVEDIKVILEDVCYSPMNSKFKVYIIDEVHMLSNSAFNALLKVLEEPPPSIKFILATTEIKRIPITIISRCQRFDLNKIPVGKIVDRLNNIAQKENYLIENGALELIARHCNNSMRNALFLMSQAILCSKDDLICVKDVMDIIGLVDKDIVFDLLETILSGDIREAVSLFEKAIKTTSHLNIFEGLLQAIQSVCRYLIIKEFDSSVVESEKDIIKTLSSKKSLIFFSRLWKTLFNGVHDIKTSTCNNIASEMLLISLCYLSDLPSPEEVVKKVIMQNIKKDSVPNAIVSTQQENFNFDKILQLLRENNQIYLYKQLCNNIQLVDCKPGYLELRALSHLNEGFCRDLKVYLDQATKQSWVITVDKFCVDADKKIEVSNLYRAPEVERILDTFKGAKVICVENKE